MSKYLLSILLLAFLLRIIGVSHLPLGFTADEANQGYTAYSLSKTGRDEWGASFPIAPRSFGEYKAPLYTYLTIIPVSIFGLSVFSTRLVGVILGSLAIPAAYYLVIEIFKNKKLLNLNTQNLALFTSFLLAISPWHISLSRGAFEPNLPTLFIPLGILFFLKGLKSDKFMALSFLSFGAGLFSYYSARFFIPMLALVLLVLYIRQIPKITKTSYPLSTISFILVSALLLLSIKSGANTRSSDVGIFNPTHGWVVLAEQRFNAVRLGLPDQVSRIFSNKPTYLADSFITNYLSFFSPQFLFTKGANEATHGIIPDRGLLYLIEVPFIILALTHIIRRGIKDKGTKLILIWLILAPIPASLAKGGGFVPTRIAILMPAIQILSAAGALILINLLSMRLRLSRKIATYAVISSLLIFLVIFAQDYVFHGPFRTTRKMDYGWEQVGDILRSDSDKYNNIIISRSFSESQIFLAFYLQIDPKVTQAASEDWLRYESEGLTFVDQLGEYNLDKYTIRRINFPSDKDLASTLLIGKPNDFPADLNFYYTIKFPNQKDDAIVIIDPANPEHYAKKQ